MINHKIFVKGLKSNLGVRSPTVSLAACFIALGALLKDAGFNLQQSAAALCCKLKPASLSKAPNAIKHAAKDTVGLLTPKLDFKPLTKILWLIINHLGIIYLRRDFLKDHHLYQQSLFDQKLKHIQYQQTPSLF